MSKHTPGPWLREGRFVYALRDSVFAGKPAKENIFDCCVQGPPNTPIEEKEATAQLISAAPDLLEALKGLIENYKHNKGGGLGIGPINKAREAIKKAEGAE